MNLTIQKYVWPHNISEPKYKSFNGMEYRKYLLELNDSTPTMMINTMSNAIDQMDCAESELSKFTERSENVGLLMTVKSTSIITAIIVAAIDRTDRFEKPEKLSAFFGLGLKDPNLEKQTIR